MSNQTASLTKPAEKAMEFTPFGAADKIKLTVEIVQNVVATKTKSGKTCSVQHAIRFMMLCQAQRLNPFAGDAYLVGYDGKDGPVFSLITAHQALLKRAETCQEFEGMESGIILKEENGVIEREGDFSLPDEQVVGGWAKVYRKGRKPTYRRLSIAQRRPNYPTPFWEGAKASEQIVKCAEADALRSTFPTLLGGLYNEGESIIDIGPGEKTAAELPTSRLVEVKSAEPQPEESGEAQGTQSNRITNAGDTEQEQLADMIVSAGFTFTQFQQWAKDTGNIQDAGSLGGFEDVKQADAKRMLRAKTGLLKGLETIKAREGGEA